MRTHITQTRPILDAIKRGPDEVGACRIEKEGSFHWFATAKRKNKETRPFSCSPYIHFHLLPAFYLLSCRNS
jgi:hypothetical protein